MQALSALTPPILVCAVVIIAIVAFLRHEMRRSSADNAGADDQKDVGAGPRSDDPNSEHTELTDVSPACADESRARRDA